MNLHDDFLVPRTVLPRGPAVREASRTPRQRSRAVRAEKETDKAEGPLPASGRGDGAPDALSPQCPCCVSPFLMADGRVPHFFRLRGECYGFGAELYGVKQEGVAAVQSPAGGTCLRVCSPSVQVIQAVFFGICVLTDLSSLLTKGNDSQEQERQLKKLISLRDWVMAVLAFPVGVFVVTMFWSIYIYDRELVYPKLLDNFIPAWLNHGMHTTVLPFVLIEMRTTHHQYPSRSCGLAAVCTFAVGYILWVCWIHHVTGVWVYPLLEHLSPGVKIIFFAAVTVIINIFYLVGEVLNNYIWDTQKCIEEGKEKPKLD
ncbi:PREDICTED: androgen-induced gene 1 protein [Nipponia nippon]|uniref:androgen-induced gene 1 protein n=1 Tax=Nipponia nippon TaxID=128390 RepID=UPI0005108D70|nr:PREDICTED: androgen-induced gene 1 protein [Nipponia nippon]